MNGPLEPHLLFNFEPVNGLNVLDPHGLHVLGAPGVNVTVGLLDCSEWIVLPVIYGEATHPILETTLMSKHKSMACMVILPTFVDRDNVSVRVEEDRGQVRLGTWPRHDEDGLALDHLGHVIVQVQPLSLPL